MKIIRESALLRFAVWTIIALALVASATYGTSGVSPNPHGPIPPPNDDVGQLVHGPIPPPNDDVGQLAHGPIPPPNDDVGQFV